MTGELSYIWTDLVYGEIRKNITKLSLYTVSTGMPLTINFPFVPNGKLMFLGVPIFKHIGLLPLSSALLYIYIYY